MVGVIETTTKRQVDDDLREKRLADLLRAARLRSRSGTWCGCCCCPAAMMCRDGTTTVDPLKVSPPLRWSCSKVWRRPMVSLTPVYWLKKRRGNVKRQDGWFDTRMLLSCVCPWDDGRLIFMLRMCVCVCVCVCLRGRGGRHTWKSSYHPLRSIEVLTKSRPSLASVKHTIAVPFLSSHWTAVTSAKLT